MNVIDFTPEDRLIKIGEVERILGLKKSSIYDRIGKGRFPRPISLGPGTVRWRLSEVKDWIAAQPRTEEADGSR